MPVTDQRPGLRGGRAGTLIAGVLSLGAVAVLAWALGSGGGTKLPAVAQPRAALHVAQSGCDDGRPPEAVHDAATPWCTLRRALQAAPSGSEVVVGPGRYEALELDGRPDAYHPVAFVAQEGERPVLAGVKLNSVRGVSFTGFGFVGGAEIAHSSDIRIESNRFRGGGITIKSSRGVRVVGNSVRHLRGTVRGLIAQGSAKPGEPGNVDLVISHNRFEDIEHDAIAVYNSHSRVRISDNRITHVREPQNFPLHTDAMQLMGGDDVTLRGNVISDVTHGILIKDGVASTGLTVERNLITDSPGAGLQVFNAPGARIVRNTVWDTRFGTILDDVPGVQADSVTLIGNVFDQLLVQSPDAVADARDNVFGYGETVGSGARVGAPRFVDPESGDFRLRGSGSATGAQKRVQ